MSNENKPGNTDAVTDITLMSIADLARVYRTSPDIIKTWIEGIKDEIGPREGRYYQPSQVKKMYQRWGLPGPLPKE